MVNVKNDIKEIKQNSPYSFLNCTYYKQQKP